MTRQKRIREIKLNKNYSGEASPYRDWLDRKGDYNQEHQAIERPEANPDAISEDQGLYYQVINENIEDKAQFFKDHFHSLTKKQQIVMQLHGIQGMSLSEVAKILKVKRSTVAGILDGARKKLIKLPYTLP